MGKSKIYTAQDQQLEDKFKIQYDVVYYQPGNNSDCGTLSLHKNLMKSQLIIVISREGKSKLNSASVIHNINSNEDCMRRIVRYIGGSTATFSGRLSCGAKSHRKPKCFHASLLRMPDYVENYEG